MTDEKKTEMLEIRVTKTDKLKLKNYAKSQQIGMSETIRRYIQTL